MLRNNTLEKPPVIDLDSIYIPIEKNFYEALEERGLLVRPRFPTTLGLHLIAEGEIGLCLNNGSPEFLSPGGRHTLWSPFRKFEGTCPLTNKIIRLGPIQIITIDQGEIGLSKRNGANIILERPGRYILQSPHVFEKTVQMNQRYIELGTHRRITVPEGFVAIAFDNGKQFIISPDETKSGPYVTDSPTFSFDPNKGFQSTKIKEIKLETLTVNTKENIAARVDGVIRYHVADPKRAFFGVEDVHAAIKLQAEATITSVFAQLSIDQISMSLSTTSVGKNEENVPDDFIHQATDLFIGEFKNVVEKWGIKLDNLNIFSMEFIDESFRDSLRDRAKQRMETATNLANLNAINEVALKNSEREAKQRLLQADAEARAIMKIADAKVYEAEKLSQTDLAKELALLDAQGKVVEKMGNNVIYMQYGLRPLTMSPYTLFNQRDGQQNALAVKQNTIALPNDEQMVDEEIKKAPTVLC